MSSSKLPQDAFRRDDESPDAQFYIEPRFCTHIDDAAIAAVTQIYREYLPSGGAILDLMSSWISHLPPEVTYRHVAGLGMNREELAANPRLNHFVVQDLNQNGVLPFSDAEFDAATICVSIDYLVRPVSVLRELARVLKPNGAVVITFSNRCFPSKAIREWLRTDDAEHVAMVKAWLIEAATYTNIEALDRSPPRGHDPLYAVIGRKA